MFACMDGFIVGDFEEDFATRRMLDFSGILDELLFQGADVNGKMGTLKFKTKASQNCL